MKANGNYFMVIETSDYLHRLEANQFNLFTQKLHNGISKVLKSFKAKIVLHNDNTYHVVFNSVSNCVFCALKIQSKFKYITPKFDLPNRKLKIGIGCGIPVTDKNSIFEEAIELTTRMCEIVKDQIVISNEIKSLYESENRNSFINKDHFRTLKPTEEKFLNTLMNYVENVWNDSKFNVDDLSKSLGYSKSQVYRKLMSLTGKSANNFIREFRLHRALTLLHEQKGNISEVAFATGFNSAAYFSKCFLNKYGILPSKYIQQHII